MAFSLYRHDGRSPRLGIDENSLEVAPFTGTLRSGCLISSEGLIAHRPCVRVPHDYWPVRDSVITLFYPTLARTVGAPLNDTAVSARREQGADLN